eukprot:3883202-Pyramimonas_sp.AAC.1
MHQQTLAQAWNPQTSPDPMTIALRMGGDPITPRGREGGHHRRQAIREATRPEACAPTRTATETAPLT